jgi:sugar/nucleoside kinase (ribokinase family)
MAKRVRKAGADVQLVIVGSVGLDTIETNRGRRDNLLGGSVSYACAAASFFAHVGMVGVVGNDFLAKYIGLYRELGIDVEGLQQVAGRTFRWSGVYEADFINRRTLDTQLGVFADFSPELPEAFQEAPFVLLGNIGPALQLHVLDQVREHVLPVTGELIAVLLPCRDHIGALVDAPANEPLDADIDA